MMNFFLYRVFRFLLPLCIFFGVLIISLIYLDPFKVFGSYQDYNDTFISLNRNVVTTRTYQANREKENFDSFIFGSSRSQAFKVQNWQKYLSKTASAFHFDASSEGIYGITTKIKYIDKQGDSIKNALLILDSDILQKNRDNSGHLFVSVPEVVGSSSFSFYFTYIKSSLNLRFLLAYLDYSLFKTYRASYMGFLIREAKYPHIANNKNGDIWYGYDTHIAKDSVGYYNERIASGTFYKRQENISQDTKSTVTDKEKELLQAIKDIFDKHNTDYKIVIAPLYDQIPLEKAQLEILENTFGKENIYNFSGKNELTEPITNFYEKSHFRPHVADTMLRFIYDNK